MKYKDMTCNDFIDLLASKAPVPGGGGASALVASVGMALGNMVGNLTIGKKKYENVEQDIIQLMEKADQLQKELLELIDKDAETFEPLSRAYKLPCETDIQKAEKAKSMEYALRTACTVPLKIMEKCCEAIILHKKFAEKGTSMVISDIGCGVAFCRTALQSASLNVFINTKLMADRGCAVDINSKANAMLDRYIPLADDIFSEIRAQL
jgi:formiminotetrahydrofolate cyclodeaminase